MAEILYVSKSEISVDMAQLFKQAGFSFVTQVKSGSEARRITGSKDVRVVVINAPLTDEFGHELATKIDENMFSSVILLVNPDIFDAVEQKTYGTSIIVLAKTVSKKQLYKALTFLAAQTQKMDKAIEENHRLQDKLEEVKLISRAKMLLMEKNKMSEEAAHKHIDKTSKDQRRLKKDVAKSIIEMYS